MTENADPEDFESKIRNWLKTHGYPLELETAKAWNAAGFDVFESEHFRDGEGAMDPVREIDVLAAHFADDPAKAKDELIVAFAIECKGSKDRPWVLLSSTTRVNGPRPEDRAASAGVGRDLLARAPRLLEGRTLFTAPERPAHGAKRVLTDKNKQAEDEPYEACQSAAKAAKYWAWKFHTDRHASDVRTSTNAVLVFPVIVTAAPLFELFLNDGEIEIKRAERGVLFWRNPIRAGGVIWIDVVTPNALASFAAEAMRTVVGLGNLHFLGDLGPIKHRF